MVTIERNEFDRLVETALRELPDRFREHIANVVIAIEDRPSEQLCDEHDVPDDLLGFYEGVPVTETSHFDTSTTLDRIYLFRDNLQEMCESREELVDEIRVTLLHEIGHHFGLDENRLEELGYA